MVDISYIVSNEFINESITCIVSDDNSTNLTMQLVLREQGSSSIIEYIYKLEKEILNINLHGIEGIISASISPIKNIVYNLDGSFNFKEENTLIKQRVQI